ncbi:unnamed protein product [Rotaria sordida]|uniref:JmjC domain-containing protein n=1 Tax=Rotaria sordida TaxID=392033 RepID=A0A814YT63_9BILA|nr:unnamed protein product [Rotaria sordida]CAF1233658.1 unnamed protein product [Rotaria sordida]
MNEATFWSSLSRSNSKLNRSDISILPNKSFFYPKYHRKYFDIHRLPKQSLLKLAGRNVTDQILPCLARAYGPGAIFPLACARQRLFSLVYHHEGGARHWYIIPARERDNLEKIFERKKSSICLEHKELLIDPSVLDKHHIQYHRIIQYPNEFVVCAAGALAQSFSESASWSESIVFALPSWIEDGHATAQNSTCQCNIKVSSLPHTIDASLFRIELIQKYISTHLNIVNYGKTSDIEG